MNDQKVNCIVYDVADGSHHLVFKIEGTDTCVGEIRVAADQRYLRTIAQLFANWVTQHRGKLPSDISRILRGRRIANH